MKKDERDACIKLLKERQQALTDSGLGRLCQKSDFTPQQVNEIKACFGPWPRALEAAGLKEPRADDRAERNREKRVRAKRNLREKLRTEHEESEGEKE